MEVSILLPCINLPSMTATIKPQDIKGSSGLPPKTLLDGGKLRLINQSYLSELNSAKREFSTQALRFGFIFHGLHIIPQTREDEAMKIIEKRVINRGNIAKAKFAEVYDQAVEDHARSEVQWESLVRQHALSKEDALNRITFNVLAVPFTASTAPFSTAQFEKIAGQVVPALEMEIARQCRDALDGPIGGKGAVHAKSLNCVRNLCWKLKGFNLVEPRIQGLVDAIEAVLTHCPTDGMVAPSDQMIVASLLRSMCDPTKLWAITGVSTPPPQGSLALSAPVTTTPTIAPQPASAMPPPATPPSKQVAAICF